METLTFNVYDPIMENAFKWLRSKYDIPNYRINSDYFEKEFGCKFVVDPDDDYWHHHLHLVFENDHDATVFMLRWS